MTRRNFRGRQPRITRGNSHYLSVPEVDIDKSIDMKSLYEIGKQLVINTRTLNWEQKYKPVTDDEIINILRDSFIETEKKKILPSLITEAERKFPNPIGSINYTMEGQRAYFIKTSVQSHIEPKIPKIEKELNMLKEAMFFGIPNNNKTVQKQKEENLLKFNDLNGLFGGKRRKSRKSHKNNKNRTRRN